LSWDKEYEKNKQIWGGSPSELAITVVNFFHAHPAYHNLYVLDVGCGYGRDSLYIAASLNCRVLGIDISPEAINLAVKALREAGLTGIEFKLQDFREMTEPKFDVILISNLYHLLRQGERAELRGTVKRVLKPGGHLFLNAISVSDPEHNGKGFSILDEPNSWVDEKFIHLSLKDELTVDFDFLEIRELYKHAYIEERAGGRNHHHVSWMLIGHKV